MGNNFGGINFGKGLKSKKKILTALEWLRHGELTSEGPTRSGIDLTSPPLNQGVIVANPINPPYREPCRTKPDTAEVSPITKI